MRNVRPQTLRPPQAGLRGSLPPEGARAGIEGRERGSGHAPAIETTRQADAGSTMVLASIVLLVVIRFFTEIVPVLPRFANFVDIPIAALLVLAVLLRPTVGEGSRRLTPILLLGFLFVAVCAVSTLVNLSRIDIAPVLLFLYGFLAPVGVFFAVHALWPPGSSLRLSRLLVVLCLVQIAVVLLINLPTFLADPGQNPDVFSGTFGENPYQLVFFLLVVVGLLAGVFTFEKRRIIAPLTPVLLIAILAIIFLAQYRALLLTTALTIILLAALLVPRGTRGLLGAAFAAAALVGTLAFVAQNLPELKFGTTLGEARADPTFYLTQRLSTVDAVDRLFADNARYTITGTGPGTFSSRAWYTFATTSDSESDVAGDYVEKLTGGRPYRTDVADKYVVPQVQDQTLISGSRAVTSPFSSYLALLAEVGVPGFALIVGVYLWALVSSLRMTRVSLRTALPGDPLPALLCASTVAFFVLLQLGLLRNWLEVTRVTFIAWMLLAVVTKEFAARRLEP